MNWTTRIDPKIKELELRQNPIIIRVNKFNEDTAAEFATQMSMAHNTGQSVIPIVIDSYGGQVYSLMSMISAVRSAELPVATIVEGKAMSCGAILFSCGNEGLRFVAPESTIMIHDVSSGAFGKNEEIQSNAKETKRLNKLVYEIMADNCRKKRDYFTKEVQNRGRADWYITPKKAKKIGLADHIGLPKLDISVSVEINLALKEDSE